MSSSKKFGDIDLDFSNRDEVLSKIDYIKASIISENKIELHKTGVYIQQVPTDPITGLCSLDYKKAEELGYIKIDFLNNGLYKGVQNEEHLQKLIDTPVNWALFENRVIVEKLYQIHDHFDIVNKMKPTSIEQLAMILAIIRPGKRYLLGKSWEQIEKEIWIKDDTGYAYKRSHAHGYSLSVLVQLNLLVEQGAV